MKLVQGEPFDHWLADPNRPPGSTERLEEGLEIFLKVCDAIAYAHHRGVDPPRSQARQHHGRRLRPGLRDGLGPGAKLTRTRPASGSGAQMEAPGRRRDAGVHGARAGARQPSRDGRALRRLRPRRDALRDRERQGAVRQRARSRSHHRARQGRTRRLDRRRRARASAFPSASAPSSPRRRSRTRRLATRR